MSAHLISRPDQAAAPSPRSERTSHGVVVHDSHGKASAYDHVVIACHSDQALAVLSDADEHERLILGAIGYSPTRSICTAIPR